MGSWFFSYSTEKKTIMRFWLFLLACIPIRLLMAWLAYVVPNPIFGLMALAVASTWVLGSVYGWFKPHGFFGGNVWWHHLRWVHAAMYLGYAVSTVSAPVHAYRWLLIDALIGLMAGMYVHTIQ